MIKDFRAEIDMRAMMTTLKIAGKDKLPKVAAECLNRTADAVTKELIRNIKKRFIVRTKYTLNSLKSGRAKPYLALNTARGKNINRMFSRAGTFSSYLWMHDVPGGHTVKGKDGGPVPIPLLEARTSKNLRKSVRKIYRLSGSQPLVSGRSLGDDRQFIGKPKGGSRIKGIYIRTNNNRKLKMLRNLESTQVKIKDSNILDDAVRKYGTPQFIKAQFMKLANRELGGIG